MNWPQAELDPVRRLRVLAAALPNAVLLETVLDAPFELVWQVAGDLEHGLPRFETSTSDIRIVARDEDRLKIRSSVLGVVLHFDVDLRPGWCLMRSRYADIGMAAAPEGEAHTRFAHFEGSVLGRWLRPLLTRSVASDLRRLEALFRSG